MSAQRYVVLASLLVALLAGLAQADDRTTVNDVLALPQKEQAMFIIGAVAVSQNVIVILRPDIYNRRPECRDSPAQMLAYLGRDDVRQMYGERDAVIVIAYALLKQCGMSDAEIANGARALPK